MKKILALILVAFSISASANGYYRGGYYNGYRGPVYVNNYGYNNNWIAPAVVTIGLVHPDPPAYDMMSSSAITEDMLSANAESKTPLS